MLSEIEQHIFREIAHCFWCYLIGINPAFYQERIINGLAFLPFSSVNNIRRLIIYINSFNLTEQKKKELIDIFDSIQHS